MRDPSGRYGSCWRGASGNVANQDLAWGLFSVSGGWTPVNAQLTQAGTIDVVARRAGHSLTFLPGIFVITQQSEGHIRQLTATTAGNGLASFPGLLVGVSHPTYMESGIDPTGRFYAQDADTWHTITAGTSTVYCDMYPAGASREITPGVPATKYNHTKGRSFSVSGTFSKSLANGSQIKILAVKGSTRKTFSGKIKSSKYYVNVKLPKGYWTLYALFAGNSTFAANDSLNGKSVHVK
jgi:hypothetical protein